MEWLPTGLDTLKELVGFLQKKAKTNDVQKKQLIMELRNNLNVFKNGFRNQVSEERLVDMLRNQAVQKAFAENFPFRKLRPGRIAVSDIREERNRKYLGWTAEQLVEKIDEKLVELRNIKDMNGGSFQGVQNQIGRMITNQYFRMKLLADFITGRQKT